ncbi:HAD family hydrolase [Cetobacterium ceti]
MIKLIVTDMDGTFLNDRHEINEEFWPIFEDLKKREITFAVASGRQYYNLLKNFDKIKNEIIFVAENGTYIVEKDKELYVNSIDKEHVKELVKIGRKIKSANVVLCGKKAAYVETDEPELISEIEKYYERYEILKDVLESEIEDEILKVTFCDLEGSELNVYPHFKEFEKEFKVAVSGKIWLDITNFNANKGVAVEKLQKMLNVTKDETMVFGDYLNDLEMMGSGTYSFAMGNAHHKLKEVANYIADTNNNGGVVKTIKEYVLNDK